MSCRDKADFIAVVTLADVVDVATSLIISVRSNLLATTM